MTGDFIIDLLAIAAARSSLPSLILPLVAAPRQFDVPSGAAQHSVHKFACQPGISVLSDYELREHAIRGDR